MPDLATIIERYDARRMALGTFAEIGRSLMEIYGGEFALAVPELPNAGGKEKPAVPNLIAQAIDQDGRRIASTVANLDFEPLVPGQDKATKLADKRRRATLGWWEGNDLDLHMYRRARWLCTYAGTPVMMRWDRRRDLPLWDLQHPLHTFGGPTTNPDDMTPDDVIVDFTRTWGWLEDNYGDEVSMLRRDARGDRASVFNLIEYNDGDETVLAVIGDRTDAAGGYRVIDHSDPTARYSKPVGGATLWTPGNAGWAGTERAVELTRFPNRAGFCLGVVPHRIGLEGPVGQYDSSVGLFELQATLMALEVHAVARGVFPDTWLIGRDQNVEPSIVTKANGLKGVIGRISGNADIRSMNEQPGYMTSQTLSYLERAQRLNALIPADQGGESASNVRTGRRGDAILSATLDPSTQEAQVILSKSLEAETCRAIALSKAFAGGRSVSFYVKGRWGGRSSKGMVDYDPADVFATDAAGLSINYAHPGTDMNGAVIRVGQLLGLGLISDETAREQSPDIDDPDQEHDRVVAEKLEKALLDGLQQQAVAGSLPPADLARIRELVGKQDMDLVAAVIQVHEEAQARQASNGSPGTAEASVDPNSAAAQPGIAQAGAGAEAGTAAPGPPDLATLLNQLRSPQRTTPAERAPVPLGA